MTRKPRLPGIAVLVLAIGCPLGAGAQDAPPVIELDLVQGEWESLQLPAPPVGEGVTLSLETEGLPADHFELLWLSDENWLLPSGDRARPTAQAPAWLVIRELRAAPGQYQARVKATVAGEERVLCQLRVRMWAIELPPASDFLYKPWYDVTMWGSRDADPAQEPRVQAFADHLASLRANVACNGMSFNELVKHARLADSGEPVTVLAGRAEVLAQDPLPRLDFSRFDPWFRALLNRGFLELDVHQGQLSDARLQTAIKLATGQEPQFGSPEWERYYMWLLGEFKRYLLELGFRQVWVKVRDEIGQTEVDEWLIEAALFKRHAWRTWTTVTGYTATRADAVARMNPVCDGWTVQHMMYDEFRDLVDNRWVLRDGQAEAEAAAWKPYTSGGAERTWAQQIFDLADRPRWKMIETVRVFDGEQELREKQGPWSNTESGVFSNRGAYIYLSPADGSDPRTNGRTVTVHYTFRERSDEGAPIAAIDPGDRVLYYSSLQRDESYADMRRLAWLALARGLGGYGTWTYYWWREPNRSVEWLNGRVISSPAVEGIRDGNEDAALYLLARERKPGALEAIIGRDDSLLPMEQRIYDRYVAAPEWRDIDVRSADQFLRARRALLELLD